MSSGRELSRLHEIHAQVAVALLAGSILTGFVMQGLGLTLSVECVALMISTILAIAIQIVAIAQLVDALSARRTGLATSSTIAIAVAASLIVVARGHYELFGVGLSLESARIAWEAVSAREAVLPTGALWVAGVVALLSALLLWLFLRRFIEVAGRRLHRMSSRIAGAVLASSFLFMTLEPVITIPHHPSTQAMREVLPWQRPATLRDLDMQVHALRDSTGGLFEQPRAQITEQYQELLVSGRALLAKPPDALERTNVLMLVMESFRADLLSANTTPFLNSLRDECLVAKRHYSTGPNTESGLFGLLNGLSMHYYWDYKESWEQPLPVALLGRMGFKRSLYRTFDLEYTNLGARFLSAEFDHDVAFPDGDPVDRDAAMMSQLIDDLASTDSEPRFDLAVTYATHWNYRYPGEFARFEPAAPGDIEVSNATLESPLFAYGESLHNRQRNAAGYTDSLVRNLFDALASTRRIENTIVVITGDHGEAFFEHGRLGHTWSLENEMVQVPLILCAPKLKPSLYTYSDHSDVFPTVFDLLGIGESTRSVTSGKSLFDTDPQRNIAHSALPRRRSLMRMAVVGESHKVEYLPFGDFVPSAITTHDDVPVEQVNHDVIERLLSAAYDARARPSSSR